MIDETGGEKPLLKLYYIKESRKYLHQEMQTGNNEREIVFLLLPLWTAVAYSDFL
jgi:hypothetical protein